MSNSFNEETIGAGYVSLAKDLEQCSEAGYLPMPINLIRLNEGNGIESALIENEAVWHKNAG